MKALVLTLDLSWKGEYSMIIQALKESGVEDVKIGVLSTDLNVNYDYDFVTEVEKVNIDEIVQNFDIFVLVGGYRLYYIVTGKKFPKKTLEFKNDLSILDNILKKAFEKNKIIITSIAGPAYLAKLGILKGRKATVYPTTDLIYILRENGVEFVNSDTVVDGNLITLKKPNVEILVKALKEIKRG